CSPSPDVSIVKLAISLWIATSVLYNPSVSGILKATPYFNFKRSAIAFLTIAWQSETLYNVDLWDFPVTGNAPSSEIKYSHGRAFVDSNSSSKVVALNCPTCIFTLSALRNHKFTLGMAEIGAWKMTLPFST